jgi:RNA polymerase sigma-70 factor (ECF subfamily)
MNSLDQSTRPLDCDRLAGYLNDCRHYLLAIATAELPAPLVSKGGASDLAQETLLAAYRVRHRFEGHTLDDVRAWLRGILRNELAAFRRRYQADCRNPARELPAAEAVAVPAPGSTDPVDGLAESERAATVRAVLDELPDDARRVVLLRLEAGLGFREVGAATGRSEEAARKAFARAVERIRASAPHLDR